jgi:hypothetical protein
MGEYVLLMHDDGGESTAAGTEGAWAEYLEALKSTGRLLGGSAVGGGRCYRLSGPTKVLASPITRYIHLQAESVEDARRFLEWNPVFEAGGTVEIRELLQP